MTLTKKIVQKIVLGGVVVNGGRILILQRHKDEDIYPNVWELPSGKREPLESSVSALVREIHEEAGLDVKIITPLVVFDYQIEKPDEIRDSTQINFLVLSDNDNVILSKEHQAFAWIRPDDVSKYDLTNATKGVISEGFKILTDNFHEIT